MLTAATQRIFLLLRPVTLSSNASLVSSATTLAIVELISPSLQFSEITDSINDVALELFRLKHPLKTHDAAV
jgi:hypothetical protein